jgi:hypothetical protein
MENPFRDEETLAKKKRAIRYLVRGRDDDDDDEFPGSRSLLLCHCNTL